MSADGDEWVGPGSRARRSVEGRGADDVCASTEFHIVGPASFGPAIYEFRTRRGWTQAELAGRARLHRTRLSGLENGRTTEALRDLMQVLTVLDLDVIVRPRPSGDEVS